MTHADCLGGRPRSYCVWVQVGPVWAVAGPWPKGRAALVPVTAVFRVVGIAWASAPTTPRSACALTGDLALGTRARPALLP